MLRVAQNVRTGQNLSIGTFNSTQSMRRKYLDSGTLQDGCLLAAILRHELAVEISSGGRCDS